ncbi:MAG: hypothetical protein R8K22_06875, partial [Mariprofundaceae bacterium]
WVCPFLHPPGELLLLRNSPFTQERTKEGRPRIPVFFLSIKYLTGMDFSCYFGSIFNSLGRFRSGEIE